MIEGEADHVIAEYPKSGHIADTVKSEAVKREDGTTIDIISFPPHLPLTKQYFYHSSSVSMDLPKVKNPILPPVMLSESIPHEGYFSSGQMTSMRGRMPVINHSVNSRQRRDALVQMGLLGAEILFLAYLGNRK